MKHSAPPPTAGYRDRDGKLVSFSQLEYCFARARASNLRALLCLQVNAAGELEGQIYTRVRSRRSRSAA